MSTSTSQSDLELFQLIQSLTKNEKGYFKKQVKLSGDVSKNYVQVFDIIESMTQYNQELLDKALDKIGVKNQYRAIKAYLHKVILRNLRNYRSEHSPMAKIAAHLQDVDLLTEKGIYKSALAILHKAIELCNDNELHALAYYLMQQELAILSFNKHGKVLSRISEMNTAANSLTANLNQQLHYFSGYLTVSQIVFTFGLNPDKKSLEILEKLSDEQFFAENGSYPDKISRVYHSLARLSYFGNKGMAKNMLGEYERLVDYLKQHADILQTYPAYFFNAVHNLALCYNEHENYPKMLACIQHFPNYKKHLNKTSLALGRFAFEKETKLMLIYYHNTNNINGAIKYITEIKKRLESYLQFLGADAINGLYFSITRIYFLAGDYKKTVEWGNKILTNQATDTRIDYHVHIKFMLLLAHYELKNTNGISYILRYFSTEKINAFEASLLEQLTDFFSLTQNKKEQKLYVKKLLLFLNRNNHYKNIFSHYFNLAKYLKKYS